MSNEAREDLSGEQLASITKGNCPDCHYRGFVLGPRRGTAINIECGNIGCRARFDVTTSPMSHRLVMGHRILKQRDGGSDWTMVE